MFLTADLGHVFLVTFLFGLVTIWQLVTGKEKWASVHDARVNTWDLS